MITISLKEGDGKEGDTHDHDFMVQLDRATSFLFFVAWLKGFCGSNTPASESWLRSSESNNPDCSVSGCPEPLMLMLMLNFLIAQLVGVLNFRLNFFLRLVGVLNFLPVSGCPEPFLAPLIREQLP
jgi:hypothetical protein